MWQSEIETVKKILSDLLDEKLGIIKEQALIQSVEKKAYKSKDVKAKLKISDGTLQNLRVNGTLKAKKVGGTYYYDPICVNRLMA